MVSVHPVDDRNSCDYCRRYLANRRLIAGGVADRRQFSSFVCYDRWNGSEVVDVSSGGAPAASPIELMSSTRWLRGPARALLESWSKWRRRLRSLRRPGEDDALSARMA